MMKLFNAFNAWQFFSVLRLTQKRFKWKVSSLKIMCKRIKLEARRTWGHTHAHYKQFWKVSLTLLHCEETLGDCKYLIWYIKFDVENGCNKIALLDGIKVFIRWGVACKFNWQHCKHNSHFANTFKNFCHSINCIFKHNPTTLHLRHNWVTMKCTLTLATVLYNPYQRTIFVKCPRYIYSDLLIRNYYFVF